MIFDTSENCSFTDTVRPSRVSETALWKHAMSRHNVTNFYQQALTVDTIAGDNRKAINLKERSYGQYPAHKSA